MLSPSNSIFSTAGIRHYLKRIPHGLKNSFGRSLAARILPKFPRVNLCLALQRHCDRLAVSKVCIPSHLRLVYSRHSAWTFGGLRRESNGRFPDAGIAKIIQSATASRAGAFRARGVPSAMRVLEILGIEQARAWGTCTLNEFRQFVGLKPYSTFAEWNSDMSIAAAAKKLYGHIDNMELHPGLHAEEPKAPGPGAGLCPGYTLSRAILADAVCLTRGDRFMTTDCTRKLLTSLTHQLYC